jgi:hypothetical protein
MNYGVTIPPLATGIKVQYRTHGGDWKDATVSGYFSGTALAMANDGTFAASKAKAGKHMVVISGPVAGTPYITRMAYVSTLGTGLWSQEFTAITPTA